MMMIEAMLDWLTHIHTHTSFFVKRTTLIILIYIERAGLVLEILPSHDNDSSKK